MMEDDSGGSDACMAHLLVDGQPVDPETQRDVSRFRASQRARLMEARRRISTAHRTEMTATLCATLETCLTPEPDMRIALYWPIRGEPDLRDWMARADAAGATILLPVVVAKNAPLVFRTWTNGCAMARGFWNIPVPADGTEMAPEVVVSPLLGVDEDCFRLGNGGGYYDRTLVRLRPRPRVIGVGFPDCVISTIFPMPWDVPMDTVVLADGSVRHKSR